MRGNNRPVTKIDRTPPRPTVECVDAMTTACVKSLGTVTEVLNEAAGLAAIIHQRLDSLFEAMEGASPCDPEKTCGVPTMPIEPASRQVRDHLREAVARLDAALDRLR
jgi:hypothetical protein